IVLYNPSPVMGLWGILCFLIFLEKSWGQEQIYVISAPKVFRVGASEKIVIQGYGYTEAFDATISIKSYPDKNFSYSSGYVHLDRENKFQNSAVLTIQPKKLPGGQNSISYVYLEVVSKHFSKLKKIPVTYDNGFLFVRTDKPVYAPHESVKVTVYSLNDDLKPAKRETVLTFIDPEGLEVDTVEENDYSGIISFPDFKILSNPKYGVWTIKAKYKENFSTTGTTYFEIQKYVAKYKHAVLRKCCYDGARRNDDESCEQRGARITIGPRCIRAFKECCLLANEIRAEESLKHKYLAGR
uniref:Anaphylatoxin-like domain-containing protein n=1 Tax=Chinchilla lanigera TaxID=34839 RepID=A0A8C2YUG1_CHILA